MIWEHDIRPLIARYETIANTLSNSGGREIKHVTDVTHYDIMDFIEKHMRREDFTREIKTPYDENLQHFVPPHVYANSISKEDSCAIIMHVSAAGMMRFDRTHSVSAHKKTGKPMATPLVAGESGLLPDPLRLAPLPFPNGDHDCIVQFNVSQAKKLVDHVYSQTAIEIDGRQVVVVPEHKPVTGGKAALVWNDDVVSEVNQYIMSQILFMLIVSRFTGATQVLSKYSNNTTGPSLHLPVMSEWQDFVSFLFAVESTSEINSVISKQHKHSLPEKTHKTDHLAMLIQSLATSDKGCKQLGKYFAAQGMGRRKRRGLVQWLVNCIAHCGDIQGDLSKLGFVSHKIVADLETVFLGLVGPVTIDSVFFGWGSLQGIECLNLPGLEDASLIERVEHFHEFLLDYLPKHHLLATACGWEREVVDGMLCSIWSGRVFSLTDTGSYSL